MSTEVFYQPEAPPQDGRELGRYLNDELTRIGSTFELVNTWLTQAVPWKGALAHVVGGSSPVIYAVDPIFNLTAFARTAAGLYDCQLTLPVINGVTVLNAWFPVVTLNIRAANYPVNTKVFIAVPQVVNAAAGTFTVRLYGLQETAGVIALVPYDLAQTDDLWLQVTFGFANDVRAIGS